MCLFHTGMRKTFYYSLILQSNIMSFALTIKSQPREERM